MVLNLALSISSNGFVDIFRVYIFNTKAPDLLILLSGGVSVSNMRFF
jgi:hypothetical protein